MKAQISSIEQLEFRRLLAAIAWTGLGNGFDWNDSLNWSGQAIPTNADDVRIVAGVIPISIQSGVAAAHSLYIETPLFVGEQAVIEVATIVDLKAPLGLEGQLRGGTYRYAGQALAGPGEIDVYGASATLTGSPVLETAITVESASLNIQSDVTLNDTLYLRGITVDSYVRFNGTEATAIRGTGSIHVDGNRANHITNEIFIFAAPRRVTLEIGIDVSAAGLDFMYVLNNDHPCDFRLTGEMNVEFGEINLNAGGYWSSGGRFNNGGSIAVGEGGMFTGYGLVNEVGHSVVVTGGEYARPTFTLAGSWSNAGTIRVRDADVYIHDYCSSSQLESITLLGYSPVTLDGTIDNSEHALALSDSTGGYTMARGAGNGARLLGGSLTLVGPNALRINDGNFEGVTLNSNVTLSAGQKLHIENRLVLNATISMSSSASYTSYIECGSLFDTGVVIEGTGTIRSTGNLMSAIQVGSNWNHALRIASGITIEGRNLQINGYSSSSGHTRVINEGTIRLLSAGDSISVGYIPAHYGELPLENNGTIEVAAGARFNVDTLSNGEGQFIRVSDLGLLYTVVYQNQGTIDLNGAMVVNWDPNFGGLSPYEQVKAHALSGRNGGAWNGVGICSTLAATDPNRTVGYAEASQVLTPGGGTFAGIAVDDSTVLIRNTIRGDLDLDRAVAFGDLLRLAQNYGMTDRTYDQGDVNFDGSVNFDDLLSLAQNYGRTAIVAGTDASLLPSKSNDAGRRHRTIASIRV